MQPWIKQVLTTIGGRVAANRRLAAMLRYVSIGAWMEQHGFTFSHRFSKREDVWAFFAPEIADSTSSCERPACASSP